MSNKNELRVFTEPEHPSANNIGWVTLMLEDKHKLFTETELYLFQCFIFTQKEDRFSALAGRDMTAFLKGGGIADYKKEYCNIDFLYPLSQKEINNIKNRAKETQNHFSIKEEIDFDLSSSDASILEAIIHG